MSNTPSSTEPSQALTQLPDIPALPEETGIQENLPQQSPEQQNPDQASSGRVISMSALNEVPVTITAVLGQKKVDVATLIGMQAGTIIEIDRKVGEAIDLHVNDTLVARGELVIVDDALGVTLTEIIEPETSSSTAPSSLNQGVA